ncbi:nitroreductase family protein [Anaeromicropila herbilytica]|uniref:Nitroreductase n=1 Tax=Anaeromicropila herbilytica TaxID=2785025 RepID=A0A7R7IER2_9FIRM|nr:nitroreductase [Anaeromicropila herbilytica]BCN31373.1 nitroreductase [Anaeromicropila herbilytica]
MNQVLENIITRKSVRSFTDKTIEDDILEQIIKAGIHAPSGMNKQSFRFTIVRNKDKMSRLAKEIATELERDVNTYNFYLPDVLIMVSDETENSNGLADCACALENIFLAAHSLGVGSVWINQLKLICDKPKIRAILDEFEIPASHTVWGMAALGYPKENATVTKERKAVIHYVE